MRQHSAGGLGNSPTSGKGYSFAGQHEGLEGKRISLSIACKINLVFLLHCSIGTEMQMIRPWGKLCSKQSFPLCAWTICFTNFSPSPCAVSPVALLVHSKLFDSDFCWRLSSCSVRKSNVTGTFPWNAGVLHLQWNLKLERCFLLVYFFSRN